MVTAGKGAGGEDGGSGLAGLRDGRHKTFCRAFPPKVAAVFPSRPLPGLAHPGLGVFVPGWGKVVLDGTVICWRIIWGGLEIVLNLKILLDICGSLYNNGYITDVI